MPECLCAADRLEVSIKGWKQHPVLILLFAGLVSRKLNSLNRRVAVDFLVLQLALERLVPLEQIHVLFVPTSVLQNVPFF